MSGTVTNLRKENNVLKLQLNTLTEEVTALKEGSTSV